jgi:hypothetical protein
MALSNFLFSPTSENPQGFSVWYVFAYRQAGLQRQLLKHATTHTSRGRFGLYYSK